MLGHMVVLFPDAFIENRLTDTGAGLGVGGRKEKVGQVERVTWKNIHYHM